jgi:hypothetical protein
MLTADFFHPGTGSSKAHERSIRTVCGVCQAGCGLWGFIQGDRIVDVQGARACGQIGTAGCFYTRQLHAMHGSCLHADLFQTSDIQKLRYPSHGSGYRPLHRLLQLCAGLSLRGKAWKLASFK